jgi:hypothetical protein
VRRGICDQTAIVTAGKAPIAPPREGFDTAFSQVRGDSDIQFTASFAKPPDPPPEWWGDVIKWLGKVLEPVAQALAYVWPVLSKLLIGALVVGVLALLWVILSPYIADWRERGASAVPDWTPAHLLLYRSIEDIEARRPGLLKPSSTSREIGAFQALSERARSAFGVIAGHVEASFFARRPLDRSAWDSSREAYRAFALDGG